MKKRAAVIVSLLATATLALVPPSQAATGAAKDKTGDAPAKLDLTRVKVSHTASKIVITTKVRKLKKRDTQYYGYYVEGPTVRYAGTSHRKRNGKVDESWYFRPDGDLVPTECGVRTKWNIKKSVIRTTIPRSCVADAGALSFRTSIGPGTKNGDVSDLTEAFSVDQG